MSIDLSPLFHPSSIAIIGASADKAKFSARVVEALQALEYGGISYLVNTNTNAVPGEHVFRRASDIPGDIDLAILFVPAGAVPSAIEDCARKGVKMAIVHGAGFAELGEEGRVQQEEMEKTARASGMRIVGPNCMGIACPSSHINMVTTRAPVYRSRGLKLCRSERLGYRIRLARRYGSRAGL
jgi:acyl-CoA synthetase (NDP forming)